ncbi:Maf family protein [Marinicella meishanensis]|uniref:Maf family protein n=1 Tax=Marinicella meishanensis TaxID=2873263 RepID=UPI001CBC4351
MNEFRLTLASASPRRAELLQQLGWQLDILPVDIDEAAHDGEDPAAYCLRMATEKSQAAQTQIQTPWPIITADTTVVFDGEILGKPKTREDALLTLFKLSGQTHQVYSAVAVTYAGQNVSVLSENQVTMATIEEADIKAYIASGEPMDKAGAYGIQGLAAMWIKHISGSYSSIMGLPLYETSSLLAQLGVNAPLNAWSESVVR